MLIIRSSNSVYSSLGKRSDVGPGYVEESFISYVLVPCVRLVPGRFGTLLSVNIALLYLAVVVVCCLHLVGFFVYRLKTSFQMNLYW